MKKAAAALALGLVMSSTAGVVLAQDNGGGIGVIGNGGLNGGVNGGIIIDRPTPVPVPASLALVGLGLAGLGLARRNRKK